MSERFNASLAKSSLVLSQLQGPHFSNNKVCLIAGDWVVHMNGSAQWHARGLGRGVVKCAS